MTFILEGIKYILDGLKMVIMVCFGIVIFGFGVVFMITGGLIVPILLEEWEISFWWGVWAPILWLGVMGYGWRNW